MTKRSRLVIFSLLGVGAVAAFVAYRYSESDAFWDGSHRDGITEKEVAAGLQQMGAAPFQVPAAPAPLDPSRPVRVTIGWLGLADEEQNRRVADLALVELSGAKGLDLVERHSLDMALREMQLSLAGVIRANDAVRVGKLLRADWFLLGSVMALNGSNSIVVRVVDARTGILRDAEVFATDLPPPQLAARLAAFVRQSRQNAAEAKPHMYLAIGGFEDLSLNNRLADFPTRLRSYLTAAYPGTNVTILERGYVNTLLQEMRLDLAGLTDESTNAPVPMQFACWLVDGYYQSYENAGFEVELVLNVSRMFGRSARASFREQPGESLFKKVKGSIDEAMRQNAIVLAPTRARELRAQLSAGRELMEINSSMGPSWVPNDYSTTPDEVKRYRRNTGEAIRAFETALLLEPTNREAKYYLASCCERFFIGRTREARDYYREIVESSVEDRWSGLAKQELVRSFDFGRASLEEKQDWFATAARQSANPTATSFYRQQAKVVDEDISLRSGEGSSVQTLAERRLFEAIQSCADFWQNKGGILRYVFGMHDFLDAFGTNRMSAAQRLVTLLPRFRAEFPEIAPHLLAAVAACQADTNAPVIAEFEQSLKQCLEHPETLFQPDKYFGASLSAVYYSSIENTNYPLGVRMLEAKRRVATSNPKIASFSKADNFALAFVYRRLERWQDALEVFEKLPRQFIEMGSNGPWGPAYTIVAPAHEVDLCRQKLGLPSIRDPREFDLGEQCYHLHSPSAFALDEDGLWIATEDKMRHLDFDLKSAKDVSLPNRAFAPVTSLCTSPGFVWIGTDGAGLIEYEKATGQCRRLTETNGLLMDSIAHLQLSSDVLWIGFGSENGGGGVGKLDLQSRRIKSFTSALNADPFTTRKVVEASDGPPRQMVRGIATEANGDLWLAAPYKGLQRYHVRDDKWETLPGLIGCEDVLADAEHVFVAHYAASWDGESSTPTICHGVTVFSLRDGMRRRITDVDGLPTGWVTALALQGTELWVGGKGFIASVDVNQGKVRKYAYANARKVDQIQVGGGFVWTKFGGHLYRARLDGIR